MLVVIDANTFYSDLRLSNAVFEIIWKYGKDLKVRLAIPEVVFEETISIHKERYSKALSDFEKTKSVLEQISNDRAHLERDQFHGSEWYRDFLLQAIKMRGNILFPTRRIYAEVLRRCLEKRRPFCSDSDKGFKDSLIWETVLDLLRKTKQHVALITRDNGFRDDSKMFLHNHLLEDLRSIDCIDRVHFFKTLPEFVDSDLLSVLPRQRRIERAFLKPGNPTFSIPDFLASHQVQVMLQLNNQEPTECRLPPESSGVTLRSCKNWVVDPEVEVFDLGRRKKLCRFIACADCIVHWRKPNPSPHRKIMTDEQDRIIAVEYLPDRSALWDEAPRRCKFRMELVIDYSMKRWVSWSDELLECNVLDFPVANR